MSGSHSELSPSSAHRWMRCPGSVWLSRGIEGGSSEAADEGTLAHEIAAACLRDEIAHVHKHPLANDLGEDNHAPLQDYVDFVRRTRDETESELYVEQTLDLTEWLGPDSWGTGDAGLLNLKKGVLRVIDLKFGKGVMVYANESFGGELKLNPQIALYALGFVARYGWIADITDVELIIHQPRRDNLSRTACGIDDLLAFGREIAIAASATRTPSPKVVAGEHQCRFCPVRSTCSTRAAFVMDSFEHEISLLNPFQIAHHLEKVKAIRDWCNDLEEMATSRLHSNPKAIPGWKLVEGRSNRRWTTSAEMVLPDLLGERAWRARELITITEAERILGKGKDAIAPITEKPKGQPTLAPEADKRPALTNEPFFETVKPE